MDALPQAKEAIDLMALTSRTAEMFAAQTAAEQRKLLHLLLQEASWKGGELRALDQFRGQTIDPKVIKHSWENTF
jgi:hypothetical protein